KFPREVPARSSNPRLEQNRGVRESYRRELRIPLPVEGSRSCPAVSEARGGRFHIFFREAGDRILDDPLLRETSHWLSDRDLESLVVTARPGGQWRRRRCLLQQIQIRGCARRR